MDYLKIQNFIEIQYRELSQYLNSDYKYLYENFNNDKLKYILSTLHYIIISNYHEMNKRLPTQEDTAHFWADNSRQLLLAINISYKIQKALINTEYSIFIDEYYNNLMLKSKEFLCESGGSLIPPFMEEVILYYKIPIFRNNNSIEIKRNNSTNVFSNLKLIGEGSYAQVFKYKDTFYNKFFIVKRAKKDLSPKELKRFKQEFEIMKELHSPYIIEVYNYDNEINQYIMEYMDYTLNKYISINNDKLTLNERLCILKQILKAIKYIHNKSLLHRDISPANILLKMYDDKTIVVKISDFGLVKVQNSKLTSYKTEFKGVFNDPSLLLTEGGFSSYNIKHEIYTLTKISYFVLTGKTDTTNIKNPSLKQFVQKGTSPNLNDRFSSVEELEIALKNINFHLSDLIG